MDRIRAGVVGSGFIARVHADSIRMTKNAELVGVADIDPNCRQKFAEDYGLKKVYPTHHEMCQDKEIDAIIVGVPNYLHHVITVDAAMAGKHVICEKPLALTIADAEEMIQACAKAGVQLCYAEELCFIPKFLRAKEFVDDGAIGRPYFIKQMEKHAGPYSPWFWKREEAGGGILMDMGCHSIEFMRFFLGKPRVLSVFSQMALVLHKDKTDLEDHAIILLEFEGGVTALLESSWALKGGMDSKVEVYGTEGVVYADLLKGMGLRMYSERGFSKNPFETQGWSCPDYEWHWNNGYPQEDEHFFDCMLKGKRPAESGEDGLVVLEIMLAAYHSAATGRKVFLPFKPAHVRYPVDLWLRPEECRI